MLNLEQFNDIKSANIFKPNKNIDRIYINFNKYYNNKFYYCNLENKFYLDFCNQDKEQAIKSEIYQVSKFIAETLEKEFILLSKHKKTKTTILNTNIDFSNDDIFYKYRKKIADLCEKNKIKGRIAIILQKDNSIYLSGFLDPERIYGEHEKIENPKTFMDFYHNKNVAGTETNSFSSSCRKIYVKISEDEDFNKFKMLSYHLGGFDIAVIRDVENNFVYSRSIINFLNNYLPKNKQRVPVNKDGLRAITLVKNMPKNFKTTKIITENNYLQKEGIREGFNFIKLNEY